jgi:hypothetical protein
VNKIDQELQDKLKAVLDGGISDEAMKAIKKATDHILYDIQGDLEYRLKDELAPTLVGWVAEMAERTVNAILEGNEEQMRRYLGCPAGGYTGRDRDASVIHGELFETGALSLRKKLVEAHRDLIRCPSNDDIAAYRRQSINGRDLRRTTADRSPCCRSAGCSDRHVR